MISMHHVWRNWVVGLLRCRWTTKVRIQGRDLLLFFRFLNLLRRERPDVFLGYTIKPNVYGSLAAHVLGIPVVNNIAGLGTAFIRNNWLTRLVRLLYKTAFSRSHHVFFQNNEDLQMFVDQRIGFGGAGESLARFGDRSGCFSLCANVVLGKSVFLLSASCALVVGQGCGGVC
jgi:hypothetical protein